MKSVINKIYVDSDFLQGMTGNGALVSGSSQDYLLNLDGIETGNLLRMSISS